MITTIAIIGSHGAGKTTIGRALSVALGIRFDEEIGARLRVAAQARDESAHAIAPQREFDLLVEQLELQRDQDAETPRVVETWHPGNAAYALERNGDDYCVRAAMRAAQRTRTTLVVPLYVSKQVARARLSERGAPPEDLVQFFLRVGRRATQLAAEWGLPMIEPICTDSVSIQDVVDRVAAHVHDTNLGRGSQR
jgi:thymidylate kinase